MPTSRLLSLLALTVLAACGGGADTPSAPPATTPISLAPPPYANCSEAGKAASATSSAQTVCMLTTQGEFVVELYADKAPITVANFLKYVTDKRYDNTLYHRVVPGILAQGGGYTTALATVNHYPAIALESGNGLSNLRGSIAMARTALAASATSQFYVNLVDNSACLDKGSSQAQCDPNGYAVFGKVIFGLSVLDKIGALQVDPAGLPVQPVATYWAQQLK